MDKIGDFFNKITPMVEASDFDKEHGALLLLGADLDHECAIYQGKAKCLIAMICSAMEEKEELEFVILQAVALHLKEKTRQKEKHEKSPMS